MAKTMVVEKPATTMASFFVREAVLNRFGEPQQRDSKWHTSDGLVTTLGCWSRDEALQQIKRRQAERSNSGWNAERGWFWANNAAPDCAPPATWVWWLEAGKS